MVRALTIVSFSSFPFELGSLSFAAVVEVGLLEALAALRPVLAVRVERLFAV